MSRKVAPTSNQHMMADMPAMQRTQSPMAHDHSDVQKGAARCQSEMNRQNRSMAGRPKRDPDLDNPA